jgi:hypothetical protein
VRAVAMVFDRYIQHDQHRPRFSKIIWWMFLYKIIMMSIIIIIISLHYSCINYCIWLSRC